MGFTTTEKELATVFNDIQQHILEVGWSLI